MMRLRQNQMRGMVAARCRPRKAKDSDEMRVGASAPIVRARFGGLGQR